MTRPRCSRETVDILTALLTTALRPDPTYRLPIPSLLVHGAHDHIGDIATSTREWAHREPLARYAVSPRRRARQQPRQPGRFRRAPPALPSRAHDSGPPGRRSVRAARLRACGIPGVGLRSCSAAIGVHQPTGGQGRVVSTALPDLRPAPRPGSGCTLASLCPAPRQPTSTRSDGATASADSFTSISRSRDRRQLSGTRTSGWSVTRPRTCR
jgi:hypothetical protein